MNEIRLYYEGNYKRMAKIAYNVTKQGCDAEEVVQETFARALKYYHSFSPSISTLHQWVNGIFTRCIKDFHRDKRLQGMSLELKDEDITSGETIGEDNKTLEEIEGMIRSITAPLIRQICYLSFIQEYTPREIAQVVDSKSSYIRNCVYRFRKDLQVVYG